MKAEVIDPFGAAAQKDKSFSLVYVSSSEIWLGLKIHQNDKISLTIHALNRHAARKLLKTDLALTLTSTPTEYR